MHAHGAQPTPCRPRSPHAWLVNRLQLQLHRQRRRCRLHPRRPPKNYRPPPPLPPLNLHQIAVALRARPRSRAFKQCRPAALQPPRRSRTISTRRARRWSHRRNCKCAPRGISNARLAPGRHHEALDLMREAHECRSQSVSVARLCTSESRSHLVCSLCICSSVVFDWVGHLFLLLPVPPCFLLSLSFTSLPSSLSLHLSCRIEPHLHTSTFTSHPTSFSLFLFPSHCARLSTEVDAKPRGVQFTPASFHRLVG